MVIVYVWYSRVCAVSKILATQFVPVDGNRDQPVFCASLLSGIQDVNPYRGRPLPAARRISDKRLVYAQ
jgi:hypothetical protein